MTIRLPALALECLVSSDARHTTTPGDGNRRNAWDGDRDEELRHSRRFADDWWTRADDDEDEDEDEACGLSRWYRNFCRFVSGSFTTKDDDGGGGDASRHGGVDVIVGVVATIVSNSGVYVGKVRLRVRGRRGGGR